MEYECIFDDLAPYGLSCRKCFASSRGEIAVLSRRLQGRLGSSDIDAERFSAFLPAFKDYPTCRELLAYLAQGLYDKGQIRHPSL